MNVIQLDIIVSRKHILIWVLKTQFDVNMIFRSIKNDEFYIYLNQSGILFTRSNPEVLC
jgi:hypothetical protein